MAWPFECDITERDWPEDFAHENGNYIGRCCECGNGFKGHKRRVICKKCYMEGMEKTIDQYTKTLQKQKERWEAMKTLGIHTHHSVVEDAIIEIDDVLPKPISWEDIRGKDD